MSAPQRRVWFCSTFLNCANNGYRGTQLWRWFQENGYGEAARAEDADVIVVNTCAFDRRREAEAFAAIRDAAARFGGAKRVLVTGCLPAINEAARAIPGVTAVGPRELERLDALLASRVPVAAVRANRLNPSLYRGADAADFHIQICQGCASRCSYCAIRRAKGPVASKPPEAVAAELDEGLRQGFRRIVLLADDCGSYGLDIGTDLAELVNGLGRSRPGEWAFNIHYLEPGRLLALWPRLDPEMLARRVEFACIPVQTLSPRTLRRMNRRYDPEAVLAAARRLRELNPRVRLETHLLYGFPGQTRAEFERDLRLAEDFDTVVCFFYTERPGIPAAKLGGALPQAEMLYRTWRLCLESRRAPGVELEYDGGVARVGRRFGAVFRAVRADVPEGPCDVLLIEPGPPEPEPRAPAALLAAARGLVEAGVAVRLLDGRLEPDLAGEAVRLVLGGARRAVLTRPEPALEAKLRAAGATAAVGLEAARALAPDGRAQGDGALPYYLLAGYEGRYGADVVPARADGGPAAPEGVVARLRDCREHLHVRGDRVALEETDLFADPAWLSKLADLLEGALARQELVPLTWSARGAAASVLRAGAPLLRRMAGLGLRVLHVHSAGAAAPRVRDFLSRFPVEVSVS